MKKPLSKKAKRTKLMDECYRGHEQMEKLIPKLKNLSRDDKDILRAASFILGNIGIFGIREAP